MNNLNENRLRMAILANERNEDHLHWVRSLNNYPFIKYDIINLTINDWYEQLTQKNFNYLLAKPPGLTSSYKQLYDERIYIIDNVLKLPVYPTPTEIYIYENKRFLYSWLKANGLPHPKTYIFYSKKEALNFVENYQLPLVSKFNIGASGSGIKMLRIKADKIEYINDSFSSSGSPKRWGPNFAKGGLIKRGLKYLKHPDKIGKKLAIYNIKRTEVQKGFVILQEYIEHDYEWRIVTIGDSYFAHKKLKIGDKASGSLLKDYCNPPLHLFDFSKDIFNKFNFTSQAIDVFVNKKGEFLINEMQCMFGQSDPYQMLVDEKPGRYRYINNKWSFEVGDFAKNQCFDLRVEHVLSLINSIK